MLSESYKKRIQELANINILEENRIQKLVAQKYPQDIIDFASKFANFTTQEPVTFDKVNQNQYIPWIADEVKKNPSITKENDKLSIIIKWIKNSGYNKISVGTPFEQVYNKAKTWLENKAIDIQSGEKIEGGDVLHTFSDGSKIIKVNNVNWCMKVGENRGWCFNTEDSAKTFVGGLDKLEYDTEGYMIIDKNGDAKLAVQYNKFTGIINDYQGAFNEIPDVNIALDSIELLKRFPIIKNITGHKDTFWNTVGKHPKFYHAFKELKNLSLPLDKKWLLGIPFTKEELKNMTIVDKHKYGLLSQKDINKLNSFTKSILTIVKNPEAEPKSDLFTPEQLEGFNEFIFEDDLVKIDIPEDVFDEDFSGMDENNRWYYNMVNSYNYYEEVDSGELNYMHFYLNNTNIDKFKEIAKMLGITNYNFEEENNLKEFIKKYFPEKINNKFFQETIFDNYLSELGYAMAKGKKVAVNDYIEKHQKFKYENGYLKLPYKDLYDFLIANYGKKPITSFKDLKTAQINGESIDLEDTYSSASPSEEGITELNRDFEESLDKFIEFLKEEGTDFNSVINKSNEILKNIGFKDNNYLIKNNRFILIDDIDFENEKYKIHYKEFPKNNTVKTAEEAIRTKAKKELKGWVKFDNLTNYVHNVMLFEIRDLVREQVQNIFEDYRYQYDIHNYIPSDDVVKTAQDALTTVQNNNLINSDGSNEGSGLKKAYSIIRKDKLTHNQLKRMKAFFDNNSKAVEQEKLKGNTIQNSPLLQTWNLWGGDAGKRWVEQHINSLHSRNDTSKTVRGASGIRTKTLMDPHNTRIHK